MISTETSSDTVFTVLSFNVFLNFFLPFSKKSFIPLYQSFFGSIKSEIVVKYTLLLKIDLKNWSKPFPRTDIVIITETNMSSSCNVIRNHTSSHIL